MLLGGEVKRIFVAFFSAFIVFGAARADCASNEFAHTDSSTGDVTCIESKFQITTIDMDADTTFKFALGAKGTFYVDWGDGMVEKIEKANTAVTEHTHIFNKSVEGENIPESRSYVIRFGGLATGYCNNTYHVSIAFGYYSSTNPLTDMTPHLIKQISGSLGAIFPSIDDGSAGQCPGFWVLFSGAYNMIGPIPENLFAGINCAPGVYMFALAFQNCTSLIGPIPTGLFSGISGTPGVGTFMNLFRNDAKLTGYIPKELFQGVTSNVERLVVYAFRGTGLWTSCPCGTRSALTGWGVSSIDGKAICEIGTKDNEHWNNGICTTDCGLGFTTLNASNGVGVPILADATTAHSINIGIEGNVCHVPLENGAANNAINVSWGGNTYHATIPDEIVPAGFTGQPEVE